MLEVQGTVLSWSNGEARVRVAAGACSDCTSHCPARSMAQPGLILARSETPLTPGQAVRLDVSLPSPVKAATLTFVLPLLGFLAGLFGGNAYHSGAPVPTMLTALAGTGLAYGVVHLLERSRRSRILSNSCATIQ